MTEERMIRVTEEDAHNLRGALMSYTGNYGTRYMGIKLMWDELELAPPKDWEELEAEYETKLAELRYQIGGMQMHLNSLKDFKPRCYYETLPRIDSKEQWHFDEFKCVSCDIREKCIYKRE